jgi:antitoxin YefM
MLNTQVIKTNNLTTDFRQIANNVINGTTYIVSRPKNLNLVIISEKRHTELLETEEKKQYLAKLDQSAQDIKDGKGITTTIKKLKSGQKL